LVESGHGAEKKGRKLEGSWRELHIGVGKKIGSQKETQHIRGRKGRQPRERGGAAKGMVYPVGGRVPPRGAERKRGDPLIGRAIGGGRA